MPNEEEECQENDYKNLHQHALCTQDNNFTFSAASQLRREFNKFYNSILYPRNQICLTNSANISFDSDYFLQEYAYVVEILLRNKTMYNIQLNAKSIGFFYKFLNLHRRVRGMSDLWNFISERSSISESRGATLGPSGKWVLDFIEGVPLRTSLFTSLASLDGTVGQAPTRIANHRQIKSEDLSETIEPPRTSFKKMKSHTLQFGDFRYESNSQKICIFSPSTDSSSSHQAIYGASFSLSKGTLHCMWKGEMPYFLFSVGDDSADVLVTYPRKQESSSLKALDYVYMFHSKKAIGRDPRNIDNCGLDYVGKMKVSSSLIINSSFATLLETEFVLVGSNKDHSVEIKSSNPAKCGILSKKVLNRLKTTHQFRYKPVAKLERLNSQNEESTRKQFHYAFLGFNEADSAGELENDFSPNLELASIIVKNHHHNNDKEGSLGGWGFKFLRSATSAEIPQEACVPFCGYKDCGLGKGNDIKRSIHVLIPAGFHGGLTSDTSGPSSLTHRWRSHGHCDCGGWDVGCPLTVFSNMSSSYVLIKDDSEEDNQEELLFIEGAKHRDPVLRVVKVNGGLYDIYFHSTLSALQSFAIAVAIIHAKVPSLCPKL